MSTEYPYNVAAVLMPLYAAEASNVGEEVISVMDSFFIGIEIYGIRRPFDVRILISFFSIACFESILI